MAEKNTAEKKPRLRKNGEPSEAQAVITGKMPEGDRTYLIGVTARNVQILQAVHIDDLGAFHKIAGDVDNGKTSILKAIEAGIRGMDPQMVRNGADSAEIILEFDEMRLNRIIPRDGKEQLFITDKDGLPLPAGEDFLRTAFGLTTFRPIDFVDMGGGEALGKTERKRKQRDMLLQALSVPFSHEEMVKAVRALGKEYMDALKSVNMDDVNLDQHPALVLAAMEGLCMEYRHHKNKTAQEAEQKLIHTPAPTRVAPAETVDALRARANTLRRQAAAGEERMKGRTQRAELVEGLRKQIAEGEALPARVDAEKTRKIYSGKEQEATDEIARLEGLLAAQKLALKDAEKKRKQADDLLDDIAEHEARVEDLAELEKELSTGGEVVDFKALNAEADELDEDAKAREQQDKHDLAAQAAQKSSRETEVFTELIQLFRDELPKQLLQKAALPIPGLTTANGEILIDGVPLHQKGTAERIKIGVQIASALRPRSGFVLVDGGEALGREGLQALQDAARALKIQVILTMVDPDALPAEDTTVMNKGQRVEAAAR